MREGRVRTGPLKAPSLSAAVESESRTCGSRKYHGAKCSPPGSPAPINSFTQGILVGLPSSSFWVARAPQVFPVELATVVIKFRTRPYGCVQSGPTPPRGLASGLLAIYLHDHLVIA